MSEKEIPQEKTLSQLVSLDVSNLNRSIVAIEYPGQVKNVQEAFRTMGGIDEMSSVHSKENRKLELRFRPDDPFSKPTHGEQVQTANLLLKVVKKTRKNLITKEEETTYHVELEGVVRKTYKFLGLCDFQYLPMIPNPAASDDNSDEVDKFISILEQVVPQKLESLDWLNEEVPIFMSPPVFSRMDLPVDYHFRKDAPTSHGIQYDGNVIGRLRKKRAMQTIFLDYNGGPVPTKPRDLAVCNLTVRFIMPEDLALVKKIFEDRPVWTKAALAYQAASVERNSLRFILASVAYYFTTGPWRNAWVRIGYDPRIDKQARNLQVLDYRISHSFKNKVIPKRSYSKYTQPHKYTSAMRMKTSSIRQTEEPAPGTSKAPVKQGENSYIYRPGMIPQCRQMFFQLCDLLVPEIEEILANTAPVETCDERYGWYPSIVEDECRQILNDHISDSFAKLQPRKKNKKKNKAQDDEEDEDSDEEGEVALEENNLEDTGDEDDDGSSSEDEMDFLDEDYKPGK